MSIFSGLRILCDSIDGDLANIRLPIYPSFQCSTILVDECSYFNSLTKPLKIMIAGRREDCPEFGFIYKVGDDLR